MSPTHVSHAIVLDPFSSGRFLVDEFERRGIATVAVLTRGVPPVFASSFAPGRYAAVLDASDAGDDFDALVARLAPFDPCCVMIGVETGIALMDRLAAHFGLPGNDPATSPLRRDKYLMQEATRSAGLRAAAQCKVTDAAHAGTWVDAYLHGGGRYPVVVKPAASAGSDNISICHSRDEVLDAVERVLVAANLFGAPNSHALVQEFLDGQEWVVDTVSCEGTCLVTNVTRYKKVRNADGKIVYRHSAFLTPDLEQHGSLIGYAKGVVQALGIELGAAHVELIETATGPVLVEVNARMHGGDAVSVLREYAPYTQLELSVDSLLAPAEFQRKATQAMAYSRHVIAHFLISRISGEVKRVIAQEQLDSIASVVTAHMPKPGAKLVVTDSLTSAPGYLWLASETEAQLDDDQDTLIAWEEDGLLYS